MASRSERIKLLAQAIGADIKSILAKTNLLKTAAYRDVGTTAGTIPQYVGANGVGGLGYGGLVTNLPASTNLDDLRYITANYSGIEKPVNFPDVDYFIGAYSLSVVAGDYGTKQVLTFVESSSPKIVFKTYERVRLSEWSEWAIAVGAGGIVAAVLPTGVNLDTLPKDNGLYSGNKNTAAIGMPDELAGYIFDYNFLLETLTDVANASYVQKLYINAYPPSGTDEANTVTYIRSYNYLGLSEWQRIAGKMYGIDVGGDVVGEDLIVNSIQAGATSPKIAYEIIRKDITYSNFGYQSDGVTGIAGMDRGFASISSSIPETDIISMTLKVFAPIQIEFGIPNIMYAKPSYSHTGYYFDFDTYGYYVELFIKTELHSTELSLPAKNGQLLFGAGSYAELFITYKVR